MDKVVSFCVIAIFLTATCALIALIVSATVGIITG
jgi:hypothetical protein